MLDLATRFDDPEVRAHALNNLGTTLPNSAISRVWKNWKSSLAIALEHNLQEDAGRAYANLVSSSVRQHRIELATRYIYQGAAYTEVHDIQESVVYIRAYEARFESPPRSMGKGRDILPPTSSRIPKPPAIRRESLALVALAGVRSDGGESGEARSHY